MGYKGTTKGKLIELEEPLPFADGTRVEVTVTPVPQPRKGSPQAVLQVAGTLTPAEADGNKLAPHRPDRRIDHARQPYTLCLLDHQPTPPTHQRLKEVGSVSVRR